MIRPPALKPGDCIGLVAPARWVDEPDLEPFIRWLEMEGFEVYRSGGLSRRHHQWSGTDSERTCDLQELLDDPQVRAVVCVRGGYGTVRMVDRLDWTGFIRSPKWVIGYSDITVLHSCLQKMGYRSLHGGMPLQFPANGIVPPDWKCWLQLITGPVEPEPWNPLRAAWGNRCRVLRPGAAGGVLVGGNLSVLYSLLGSSTLSDFTGRVLFLEDVDEYLYHIDRMMVALRRCGVLEGLSGLLIGDFSGMKDHAVPFGLTVEEIIMEAVAEFHYPVLLGIPAGHGLENWPLEMGATVQWGSSGPPNDTGSMG